MTERQQFLDDVIITALEGGINEWAVCSAYEHTGVPARAQIQETDYEGKPDGPLMEVDRALIERGIKEIVAGESNLNSNLTSYVILADRASDAGNVDAAVADAIVQVGLFGNLVYG